MSVYVALVPTVFHNLHLLCG